MKIGLDYDHTYTEEPRMWEAFVLMAKYYGHEVKIVTFRMENREGGNPDVLAAAEKMGVEVVFCNGEPKASQYEADIWIDDWPALIPTPDQLAKNGEIRQRVLNNEARPYEAKVK